MINTSYDQFTSISAKAVQTMKETTEKFTMSNPLVTYKELCDQYPNITFRISDRNNLTRVGNSCVDFGYQGSLHQVGDHYGDPGTKSVTIDVECLRKMQESEDYRDSVLAKLDEFENIYKTVLADGQAEGAAYTDMVLQDENGKVVGSFGHSSTPFSTEESIRKMWNVSDNDTLVEFLEQKKNQMFDSYLEMLEKSDLKRSQVLHKIEV